MTEILFTFPVVLVEGNIEEKRSLYNTVDDDIDYCIGEIDCDPYDFTSVMDMWMPTKDSLEKAKEEQKFDACVVTFKGLGSFLVPWTKKKFKAELDKFVDSMSVPISDEIPEGKRIVRMLSKEDLENLLKHLKDGRDEDKE